MAELFRGRVRRWFTFNEPQCFIGIGYGTGEHAPGLRLDSDSLSACWETFYQAHTLALDPLCFDGRYEKPDFIGVNLYQGAPIRAGAEGAFPTGFPRTAMGWPITPEALEWGPRFLAERYGLPLVVSENGLACMDRIFLDGAVHDPLRIDFLTRYLRALERAIDRGTDVRGYFHWSLTDNFEWAEGYAPRFGLAYVDYATGDRTLKDSGRWYRQIIRSNGAAIAPL